MSSSHCTDCYSGYRVAQVKVIFSIPKHVAARIYPENHKPPPYLAYVEWFTAFENPRLDHLLFHVKQSLRNGQRLASVIPLQSIRRGIHLYPAFGAVAPREWTSSNVLDLCPTFFVNPLSDRHSYHTVN